MNKRVEENIELAYHAAMTTRNMWVDWEEDKEEAKAAAVEGMIKGDLRFDPDKHPQGEDGWSQYVWMWARASAQGAMRVTRAVVTTKARRGRPVSEQYETEFNGESYVRHAVVGVGGFTPDQGDDIIEGVERERLVSRVLDIVSSLPVRERLAFEHTHGLNGRPVLKQADIAKVIGQKARSGAGYYYAKALAAVREGLEVVAA